MKNPLDLGRVLYGLIKYEVPYEAFFVLGGGETKTIAKWVKQVGGRIL